MNQNTTNPRKPHVSITVPFDTLSDFISCVTLNEHPPQPAVNLYNHLCTTVNSHLCTIVNTFEPITTKETYTPPKPTPTPCFKTDHEFIITIPATLSNLYPSIEETIHNIYLLYKNATNLSNPDIAYIIDFIILINKYIPSHLPSLSFSDIISAKNIRYDYTNDSTLQIILYIPS